jgi:protein O-mannosyl-transferase
VYKTWNNQYTLAALVAFATIILYLPALHNQFVGEWDDNNYIVLNYHIRSLDASFFHWAFFAFHASNWHPLTWISHALDYALWGLNPLGHHFTSIILHSANAALVVLLVMKLLGIARERTTKNHSAVFLNDRTIPITAAVTGFLFGFHPVHVESVAWVSERKDLLCALFFLLSIMAYANYAVSRQSACTRMDEAGGKKFFADKQYYLTLVLFAFALMSKPMAVTLPVVLLILDWHPFNRINSLVTFWVATVEKSPFFVLSLASSVVTILAQDAGQSIGSLQVIPLSSRVLVSAQSLIAYLGKMLLPLNLVPFYPYPKNVSLFSLKYAMAIILVIGITTVSWVLAKKQRLWLSVWAYFVVTLVPVLGIVQVGYQSMADRYTYLPSLGPFFIAGLCFAGLTEKARRLSTRPVLALIVPAAGAVVLISFLSFSTVQQIGIWKNSFVLWDDVITKGFQSATAYNNRGLSLDEMEQPDKAIADFEQAIVLDPRNYFAYNNLGVIYGKEGHYHRSLEYFLKAIAVNPEQADSYFNLGLSYFNLNNYDGAIENFTKAIELKHDFDMAYLNRGEVYIITGNKNLAAGDYRKACDLGNRNACELLKQAIGD